MESLEHVFARLQDSMAWDDGAVSISDPTLVVFHGDSGDGAAESLLARVRIAAAKRSIEAAMDAGFATAIIATDDVGAFSGVPAVIDPDTGDRPFAFAARLRELVARFGLARPVVMGSGSLPLLGTDDFRTIAAALADETSPRAITNNFFSGDVTGWTPGSAIEGLGTFERDNMLPRRLRDVASADIAVLPRTTATLFDIDTPTDVAILSLDPRLPAPLADVLRAEAPPVEPLLRIMPLLCDRTAEIVIAGRIGSQAWQHMERETACRVRVFSEERGMAAAGPDYRPRSLVGFALEDAGPVRFFARMAELGDALILDRRVIEAHLGIEPPREDRFRADIGHSAGIENDTLREFVEAAAQAPMPVVMGGHSLVSGGLMLLNDLAWIEADKRTTDLPTAAEPPVAP